MAVRDCIVNKKSQAEIATKYNISRSRIQQTMSEKKRKQERRQAVLTGEKKKNI